MSVIIIMAILMIIVVSSSLTGFFSRFNILDSEFKERSVALADACVDTTLSRLAFDATYAGPEAVSVGSDTCNILSALNPVGNPRTYKIQAIYQKAYTNLLVTIDINTLSVTSWQEVPTF